MHVLYMPELECPVHFTFTSPRINDIEEGKKIKIEKKRIYIFDRAYYDFKWWLEFTEAGSTFVTRPKSTLSYKTIEKRIVSEDEIKFDHMIKLCSKKGVKYKGLLRLINVSVEIGGQLRAIKVITNNMILSAGEIARLYKKRWQIELFFKWIKQTLKIKKFFGENEKAIKIQIIIGLIACLLTKLLQSHLKEPLSMRNIVMFLRDNVGTFVQNWVILKPPTIIPQFTITTGGKL